MMIQATVPSALGLFYTPWLFDAPLALAAGMTTLAILYLVLLLRNSRLTARKLSFAALGYLAFAAAFLFFTLA
jgi:cation:H+ antiporter